MYHSIVKAIKRAALVSMASAAMLLILSVGTAAKTYTTARKDLPLNTDKKVVTVTINTRKGPKDFTIAAQLPNGLNGKNKKTYITMHGCAVSALRTVLAAYRKKYVSYNRVDVYRKLERKVFGKSSWASNYHRSLGSQMPVSMYGISKVLRYCGISNTYVRRFRNKQAVKRIENHLKRGNVAIVETNCRRQRNGHFYGSINKKWAGSKHTLLLLGMTKKGRVIVADSADRIWAGQNQRIKYVRMSELVQYMFPCSSSRKHNYFHYTSDSGGYILVK